MTRRRIVLAAGVPVIAWLGVALGLIPRFMGGELLDPTAANTVPFVLFDTATIETEGSEDAILPGVEGSVLFARLVHQNGATVLDRPFEWPSDKQAIPPGRYALTVYWRTCVGNCGRLDGESPFCKQDVSVPAGGRIHVFVTPRNLAPGFSCSVSSG
jgi:hypothetical protein